ncbi:MAG: hypothetical protein JXC85_01925 [Candidatus Aenigmarchaeota archaeon]|nr:hypothetical protein [Candidatus Aenigmarchaeota archaeon]
MMPVSFKHLTFLALIAVILASGCVQEQPIIPDTDEHGCILNEGYSWCEARQKCLRTWEQDCLNLDCDGCVEYCAGLGYLSGMCGMTSEAGDLYVEKAGCLDCLVADSGCSEAGECNCYCLNETVIGGDKDEHGCLIAAGYLWCESKRKCLREWDEECPSEIFTAEECQAMGGSVLNIVGGDGCHDNETAVGGVSDFISPNVCCLPKEKACTESGGVVSSAMCCLSAGDFPSSCLIGACGCAPGNSHEVKTCDCGEGKCFDGNECRVNVIDFLTCAEAGNGILESYPLQCRTPEGQTFVDELNYCSSPDGVIMSLEDAKQIALGSECVDGAQLTEYYMCNFYTGTWWLDIDLEKAGCNPACVVDIVKREAEINWRCTGALPE